MRALFCLNHKLRSLFIGFYLAIPLSGCNFALRFLQVTARESLLDPLFLRNIEVYLE